MDEKFEALKTELFLNGSEAITDFLGFEYDPDSSKDEIENLMDEVYAQIPDEELEQFFDKYSIN